MTTIKTLYKHYTECSAVSTDSRKIEPASMFFALKGPNFDGNKYAVGAIAAGARFAVVDDQILYGHADEALRNHLLLVEDVLKALQQLAMYHRKKMGIPIIAITGTNGKTTTKELVASVLSKKYKLLYTEGNLNNHIGVPLTLLRINIVHQLAVVEMGASKPGDIKELVEIAQPNYGLITNMGKAHIEGFGSLEGVRKTKGELYDYLRDNDGVVFVNNDDDMLVSMCDGIKSVQYGSGKKDGLVSGEPIVTQGPFLNFEWRESLQNERTQHSVQTHLVGNYNMPNALAAIALGVYFDVPTTYINDALGQYEPANSRSQYKITPNNHLIVDAYNANATSMNIAIRNFAEMNHSMAGKTLVLGDMLELGTETTSAHQEIVDLLESLGGWSEVYLVGAAFGKTKGGDAYQRFNNVTELKSWLVEKPIKSRSILIKGSNGIHLQDIVDLC